MFYRLNVVKIFGTSVLRIMNNYSESLIKPKFEITENSISVELPVVQKKLNLSKDKRIAIDLLAKTMGKSISEITAELSFGKFKTG